MAFSSDKTRQGAAGAGGGYEINQSLRFNDDDSAYLSWTPSSAGNRKTWTWSGWVKRGELGSNNTIFGAGNGGTIFDELRFGSDNKLNFYTYASATYGQRKSTAVFRDTSAWYHIVAVYDSTDSTALDRMKLYVNGEQVTNLDITNNPSQNHQGNINNNIIHAVGAVRAGGLYNPCDGYIAEVNFIDGQALDPSNFGETGDYGEWKPIEYTGTYGTNGFYLDFGNSGSLGADSSGNGNNWTPNNLAATDQMLDSPTNNFATLNPLEKESAITLSEGNTKLVSDSGTRGNVKSTHATENMYFEVLCVSGGGIGTWKAGVYPINILISNQEGIEYGADGSIVEEGTVIATGYATLNNADILGITYNGTEVKFYKNNSLQYTHSWSKGVQTAGFRDGTASAGFTAIWNFGQDSSFAGNKTGSAGPYTDDNGYGDFYYEPPTGFNALCTQNLDDPDVIPSEHFNTVLYTGNSSTQSITGVGFQPDFVWLKARSTAYHNSLLDVVRGTSVRLRSNTTDSDQSTSGQFSSFDSDGFTLVYGGMALNESPYTYVSWNWKANGSGVSNTDGTIQSTVSANTDAGFSIVSYTGTGANATVGHGLSSTPEMVIEKRRDGSGWSWYTQHTDHYYGNGSIYLNGTATGDIDSTHWNNTAPTPSVFSVGTSGGTNGSSGNHIAYCFHSVDGYSKVGSYTGNGSTDGTFVYTGFRPAYVMLKLTSSISNWVMQDSARDSYNAGGLILMPNNTSGEMDYTSGYFDFHSNGFKLRNNYATINGNGSTYIYLAFAEHPFKHTNAR